MNFFKYISVFSFLLFLSVEQLKLLKLRNNMFPFVFSSISPRFGVTILGFRQPTSFTPKSSARMKMMCGAVVEEGAEKGAEKRMAKTLKQ